MSLRRIAGPVFFQFILLMVSWVLPGNTQEAIVRKLSAEGSLRAAGVSFRLALGCEDRRLSEDGIALHGYSGTVEGCLVTSVTLEIEGKPVSIPEWAYSDLLNPAYIGGLSIREAEADLVVSLRGGDGESGYQAKLVFCDGAFERREIQEMDEEGEMIELVERLSGDRETE